MDFFEPLWKNRNNLLHRTVNLHTQEDDTKLSSIISEYQGTADTPLLFSMLSNVAIQAHKSYTPGLTLESPTLQRQIQHHNIAYVDNADGHVSANYNSADPTIEATEKMNVSAQGWNDVNNLTGGSLAYHKTKWQMIAWEEIGSTKQLKRTTTQNLRINDWTGAPTTIKY